jgi:predicted nucleotidyltransferase component of viral defense system
MSRPITLTVGWIARHTPPGAGVDGRDAAVIDIAQDLLLRDLHTRGALDTLVFKGGTSLRKLYAGNHGRFSLDLDFSLVDPAADPDTIVLELVSHINDTSVGPITYGITERRGKWWLTITSPFTNPDSTLSSKLDVSPPPWLPPVRRGWIPMPIHATYGDPALPQLQVVRLEENIAEKISRLNRTTTARDMYDLAWLATHQRDFGGLDTNLIRRLAVLKIWVDANGATAATSKPSTARPWLPPDTGATTAADDTPANTSSPPPAPSTTAPSPTDSCTPPPAPHTACPNPTACPTPAAPSPRANSK